MNQEPQNVFASLRAIMHGLDDVLRQETCEHCGKPLAVIMYNRAGYRRRADLQSPDEAGLCGGTESLGPQK